MQLRVFNYNTHEKVHSWDAHSDYIRCIAVHPTLPYVLSGSDDMTIRLWDWDKNWKCIQVRWFIIISATFFLLHIPVMIWSSRDPHY